MVISIEWLKMHQSKVSSTDRTGVTLAYPGASFSNTSLFSLFSLESVSSWLSNVALCKDKPFADEIDRNSVKQELLLQ